MGKKHKLKLFQVIKLFFFLFNANIRIYSSLTLTLTSLWRNFLTSAPDHLIFLNFRLLFHFWRLHPEGGSSPECNSVTNPFPGPLCNNQLCRSKKKSWTIYPAHVPFRHATFFWLVFCFRPVLFPFFKLFRPKFNKRRTAIVIEMFFWRCKKVASLNPTGNLSLIHYSLLPRLFAGTTRSWLIPFILAVSV